MNLTLKQLRTISKIVKIVENEVSDIELETPYNKEEKEAILRLKFNNNHYNVYYINKLGEITRAE